MAKLSYTQRASKRFLAGAISRTPVDAVERGERSLSEWTRLLAEERELDLEHQQSARQKRFEGGAHSA